MGFPGLSRVCRLVSSKSLGGVLFSFVQDSSHPLGVCCGVKYLLLILETSYK